MTLKREVPLFSFIASGVGGPAGGQHHDADLSSVHFAGTAGLPATITSTVTFSPGDQFVAVGLRAERKGDIVRSSAPSILSRTWAIPARRGGLRVIPRRQLAPEPPRYPSPHRPEISRRRCGRDSARIFRRRPEPDPWRQARAAIRIAIAGNVRRETLSGSFRALGRTSRLGPFSFSASMYTGRRK